MEREYAIVVGMLHMLMAYAFMSLPVTFGAIVSLMAFLWSGRALAKRDPQTIRVMIQELENKSNWLAAGTHPSGPPTTFKKR